MSVNYIKNSIKNKYHAKNNKRFSKVDLKIIQIILNKNNIFKT